MMPAPRQIATSHPAARNPATDTSPAAAIPAAISQARSTRERPRAGSARTVTEARVARRATTAAPATASRATGQPRPTRQTGRVNAPSIAAATMPPTTRRSGATAGNVCVGISSSWTHALDAPG